MTLTKGLKCDVEYFDSLTMRNRIDGCTIVHVGPTTCTVQIDNSTLRKRVTVPHDCLILYAETEGDSCP